MDELLTIEEVCKVFKISRRTLERWRKRGLTPFKVGTLVRFYKRDIENWIKQNKEKRGANIMSGMSMTAVQDQIESLIEIINQGKSVFFLDPEGEYKELSEYYSKAKLIEDFIQFIDDIADKINANHTINVTLYRACQNIPQGSPLGKEILQLISEIHLKGNEAFEKALESNRLNLEFYKVFLQLLIEYTRTGVDIKESLKNISESLEKEFC